MNLYKYRRSTGYEGYCVAISYSDCEKLLNEPNYYKVTKIELIEEDIKI